MTSTRPDDVVGLIRQVARQEAGGDTVALGTVATVDGTSATVVFDGETAAGARQYPAVNYSPVAGDRVALLRAGSGWIILGKVGSGGAGGAHDDADHADAFAALGHAHDLPVLNTGLQSSSVSGVGSMILPFQSELTRWTSRGSNTTSQSAQGGATIAAGLNADGLTNPNNLGSETMNVDTVDGSHVILTYDGGFTSWASGAHRRAWVRLRTGGISRVTVQARWTAGAAFETVHNDQSPTFVGGSYWISPEIDSTGLSGLIYNIVSLRFLLWFNYTGTVRIDSVGWYHPNIPFGWHAFAKADGTAW